MCKSRFVFFILAVMVVSCVLPAQFVSAQAPLGTNLAGTVYYSTELPFKNVGRTMDIRDESGRDRIYLLWDIEGHFPLGDYVILYDGSGSIDSFSGGTVVEQSAGRIVISKSAGQGLSFLRDKTISNMRIIFPGYEGSYESDRWYPSFLSKWDDFTVIRFMDWTHTNNSPQQNWSDRPLVSDERWTTVPWEICIEFANRLDADPWICIPHLATDDYVTQLANLVDQQMATGHKVHVEYSNECWNSMFSQEAYCRSQGVAEELSDNEWQAGDYWYSKRAVQIHDIFEGIVGASRLVRVLSAQAGNTWRGENILGYNNAYQVTDVYAIAPYFGGEYGNDPLASSVQNWTLTQLFNDIQNSSTNGLARARQMMVDNQAVATSYGVGLACYEAGQHLVGVGSWVDNQNLTNLLTSANRDARMNDCYDTYINDWDTEAGGLMALFSSCSKYIKWGSWGLTEWHEQTDTPKYTAAMDWIGAAPQPPGQASNPSPANGATDISVEADISWTAGSGATSHDVYFGQDSTPDSGEFQGNQTGTTFDPGTLAASTTYYWRIDSVNAQGTTTGVVWSFTTEAAPQPPGQATNPSPADGATGVNTTVTLSWTAGSGAISHDVYFGTPSSPPFIQNQAGTTYDPGTLAYDTTYYWRIDEKNAVGTTTGVVWSFTTGSEPVGTMDVIITADDQYELYVNGQLLGSDSTWAQAQTYSSIELQGGENVVAVKGVDTGWEEGVLAELVIDGSREGTSTDWKVSLSPGTGWESPGFDDSGWANASDRGAYGVSPWGTGVSGMPTDTPAHWIWSAGTEETPIYMRYTFTVGPPPPGQASNPNPADGATNQSVDVDLSWTAGTGATSHNVYFGQTSPGTFQGNQPGTTFDPGTLANDVTYYWRIDEVGDGGTTTGVVWSFTTEAAPQPPGQASNPSPADGATNQSVDVDLSWTAGSGAISHDVYFGQTSPGDFQGNQAGTTFDPGTLANNTTYYWRIDEKNAVGTTTGVVWSFTTAAASAADADIAETSSAPTIDGSVDSVWANAPSYSITTVISGTVSSDTDLSGTWRALWDSSNLYYLVEVTDDALNNDSTDPWDDDSVELYIDADNSKGTSYDGVNDYQYVFRYNDGTIHLGSNSATNTTGIDFTIIATAGGYTFEVSIPWSTLGVTPAQGNLIGTDVHLNDDDDGSSRDGKKAWFGDDTAWTDPSVFGTAELVAGAAPPPPGQASNPSPADGATDVSIDTSLSWTAGTDATSHDVYFGTDSTPDSGEFTGNQTGTTYDPGTLYNEVTYYWRIDEVGAGGTTTGDVWSFTTEAATPPPGQASNPNPADGATDVSVTTTLSWTAGSDATSHDVYFGQDSTPDSGEFQGNQTGTTFDPGTLANDTTYYWRIDEKNAIGTTTGVVWSFTTAAAGPGPGNGTGLTGDYYDNIDFTGFVLTRVDATVNFDWGSGSPDPTIGADTFSVQWTGQVEPMYSETYTFYTTSDDGVRLWVNGQLIIDNWTDHAPTENSGTIALTAGTKYDIAMDFYENGGGAVAKLEWSSANQAREVIPQTQLYEAAPQPPDQASNPSPADGATGVNIDADLSWTAGSGAESHDVYFGTVTSPPFVGNQTGTTYDPGTLNELTTYYWRIDEVNANGTTTGVVWSFTTAAPSTWTSQDIGSPGVAGSASEVAGTWTIEGDGSDISGTSDSFHYVYQSVSGNCEIIARVVSLEGITADWAKAGVMFRKTLAANSTYALNNYTTNVARSVNSWTILHRDSTGGTSTQTVWGTDQSPPYWMRLVRSGNNFSAYVSSNGSSWELIDTVTISMATDIYVGMAVTSHDSGSLSTGTFDNVQIIGG